jgi:hypothetical protein
MLFTTGQQVGKNEIHFLISIRFIARDDSRKELSSKIFSTIGVVVFFNWFFFFSIFSFLFSPLLLAEQKLKIYCLCDESESFQRYWMNFIQKNWDCEIQIDPELKNVEDFSIVFIQDWHFKNPIKKNLLKKLNSNKKLMIIHLGDELCRTDWKIYKKSFCTFREYFTQNPDKEGKVFYLPLVCKHDFITEVPYNKLPSLQSRQYVWSFVGQVSKSNRQNMYLAFRKLNLPSYDHFNSDFDSRDCLKTEDYQNIMQNSIFSPCPKGWTIDDTYRLYEALECGCIPVVEKGDRDYFRSFYGDVPFIVLDEWKDARQKILPLLNDLNALEDLRRRNYDWWQNKKIETKNILKTKIDEFLNLQKK